MLWKASVPFKIKVFGWRCFLNRLSSKDQLFFRGIVPSKQLIRLFYFVEEESVSHLLFQYVVSKLVWREVSGWLGMKVVPVVNAWSSFFALSGLL